MNNRNASPCNDDRTSPTDDGDRMFDAGAIAFHNTMMIACL
jgi:hypothetical protein